MRPASQKVGAARVDLAWIGHTLQPHLNSEPGALDDAGDVCQLEEAEVKIHGVTPPFVQVPYL
jgi:hypothetical protein